ncbi:helix-turn-helix domain-containing protein [Microbacterium sp.]|uniref:helix-turn-helix domain-containing protein n=1 Tax=Microbacterium sp. TaxID=51671 RepID=UPI00391A6AD8
MDLLHAYSKHFDGHATAEVARGAAQSRRPATGARRTKTARQLRPSEVDDLVVRYQKLGSVADVARQFGVTRQTVGMHLASRGIETVRRMSEADITAAAELYREGHSAATIGRRLGFDPQTVLNGLRRADVPIRPHPGRTRPHDIA